MLGFLNTPEKKVAAFLFVVAMVIIIVMSSTSDKKSDDADADADGTGAGGDNSNTDAAPGAISGLEFGVSGEEADEPPNTESYTTIDEMDGVTIDLSFVTPKSSFGFGNLALKDYVISLGTSEIMEDGTVGRKSALAVIIIPRTRDGALKLITPGFNGELSSTELSLTGDFNALDNRVSITMASDLWTKGNIILPQGDVFVSVDYTSMDIGDDYEHTWIPLVNEPLGRVTKSFVPGGVTLGGTVRSDGGFVANPNITDTVNEELNIAVERGDIGGSLQIRKQIGNNSRFLISPIDNENIYLAHPAGGDYLKAAVLGTPSDKTVLNKFRVKPTPTTDIIRNKLSLSGVTPGTFFTPDSNWFNFAIMQEAENGWKRMALISNFEVSDGEEGGMIGTAIKPAQYPIIFPLEMSDDKTHLTFPPRNSILVDVTIKAKLFVKFVRPLASGVDRQDGKVFSICVRKVATALPSKKLAALNASLTAEDRFLVHEGGAAVLKPLKEITDLRNAVFKRRNPVDGNTPAAPGGGGGGGGKGGGGGGGALVPPGGGGGGGGKGGGGGNPRGGGKGGRVTRG
jgi:hypothetical protein